MMCVVEVNYTQFIDALVGWQLPLLCAAPSSALRPLKEVHHKNRYAPLLLQVLLAYCVWSLRLSLCYAVCDSSLQLKLTMLQAA